MKRKLNRTKIQRLEDEDYVHYTKGGDLEEVRLGRKWAQRLKASNRLKVMKPSQDILAEITKYKEQAVALRVRRETLYRNQRALMMVGYEHFVRGILGSGSLNIEKVGEWKKYRDRQGITEREHLVTLKQFGFKSDDDLDRIKTYVFMAEGDGDGQDLALKESKTTTAAVTGRGGECVICWSSINHENVGYMITPCNHVCLCQKCANDHFSAPHDAQKCPKCVQAVSDVKTVYFS